jgi:hypothetical protein
MFGVSILASASGLVDNVHFGSHILDGFYDGFLFEISKSKDSQVIVKKKGVDKGDRKGWNVETQIICESAQKRRL